MENLQRSHIIGGALVFLLIIGAIGLSITSNPITADSFQIAYFDAEDVFTIHPAVQEAQQKLMEEQQKIMQELEGLDEEEQMMQQQMMQQQFEEFQAEVFDEALTEVRADIQKIADENGFDYVLDRNVIFAGGEEITDAVVDWVEEEYDVEEEEVEDEISLP